MQQKLINEERNSPNKVMENVRKKQSVLLMEDDPIVLRVHRGYLEKMGYIVDTATTGQQALEFYRKNHTKYVLVILDVGLPDIDGFMVAKYIRQYEKEKNLQRIHLLLLTGYPKEQIQKKCALVEIDDFLNKPAFFEPLSNLLKKWGVLKN